MMLFDGLAKQGKVLVVISAVFFAGCFGPSQYAIAKSEPAAVSTENRIVELTAKRQSLVAEHKGLIERQREVEIEFWKVTGALNELQNSQNVSGLKK